MGYTFFMIRTMPRFVLLNVLLFLSFLCTTPLNQGLFSEENSDAEALIHARRGALVKAARSFLGQKKIAVPGKRFNSDCSGTIFAICWTAGLDLQALSTKSGGKSGTESIYRSFSAAALLRHSKEEPLAGDIIFWDDSYDHNGNGKVDDPLSHVGIVVSVEKNGRIGYLHYRYDKGVVEEYMNLRMPQVKDDPQGLRMNSNMRISSWKPEKDSRQLSGELYHCAGITPALKAEWR